MIFKFNSKKILSFLLLASGHFTFAQQSLKFENGGGPTGSGPSVADRVVTMYNGDGAVYSPTTTVTFSLSNQQYTSIEGNATTPGVVFGGNLNNSGNAVASISYYMLLNGVGGSGNAQYSTDGALPAINVANDYGIEIAAFADALLNSNGTNKVPTNSENVQFADLTLTFNRPVSNPVVHFTGLGGTSGSLGFAAGFDLLNAEYTITRLNGSTYFGVTGNSVRNTATTITTSSASGGGGAAGSIRINGTNITSVTFKVILRGDGGGSAWSATNRVAADGFLMSVSLMTNSIAGTVYNDNNGGTPNGTGYGGANVALKDQSGNIIATTTSAADGSYSFSNVLAGDYFVEITSPSGYEVVGSSDGDTDGITSVTVGSTAVTGVNFGINEAPTATDDNSIGNAPGSPVILNILSNDTDPNNGVLSPDSVSLAAPAGATNVVTNANGKVTGFGVPGQGTWAYNGDGTLTFTPEAGFTGDPTPITYTVTDHAGLESNPATVTIDYNDPVTVSGTVYNDNNGGTPDGTSYAGVVVTLKDAAGNTLGTAITDADGNYSFEDIIPGNYSIEVTPPAGFENIGSTAGNNTGILPITVGSTDVAGQDFGINEPPAATDETLANQSPGSAATVNILNNDSDPNGGVLSPDSVSLVAPTGATNVVTNAGGKVTGFTVPGEGAWIYNGDGTLTFIPEAGFTGDPTPITYTVTDHAGLESNPAVVTIDYNDPVTVSGTVYNDNNGGAPDGTGYGGVTVTLKDAAGNVVATTTTDADGNYSFEDIIPGNYSIEVTPPAGFENVGSTAGNNTGIIPVTVGSTDVAAQDFGINEPPAATDDTLANQSPGSAATVNILNNDSDPNGGVLSADSVSLVAPTGATNVVTNAAGKVTGFTVPGEGAWTYNGDGTLTFTPEAGFTGDPTPITYTVTDHAGLDSNPATVMIIYDGPPLPVTLLYLDAKSGACSVVLSWATAIEDQFDRFEVERSPDGRSFQRIAGIPAKGSNSEYDFIDKDLTGNNYYYRLKMTDADGSATYSKAVSIFVSCNQPVIAVYPNPATDQVTITGLKGTELIEMYNSAGVCISRAAAAGPLYTSGISAYPAGMYIISVRDRTGREITAFKLIKK